MCIASSNNEEIILFRSVGGAYVGPHTGAVNNQINIHLTLKGGKGVYLEAQGNKGLTRNKCIASSRIKLELSVIRIQISKEIY